MSQSVLIIDDSRDIHELLEVRLRPESVVFHHALDAQAGLALAAEVSPDLILLDQELPGANGLEVCSQLRAHPKTQGIPVIFLTATADVATKVKALDAGAVDYVVKPFDAVELRARVRATLRTKRFQDLLATRAQVDGLTALWNRRYFDAHLEAEVCAYLRHRRPLGLAMIDLDHFKAINDVHGHPFGDKVLQLVAECVSAQVRAADAVCRYGGEELGLILSDASTEDALRVAGRVCRAVESLRLTKGDLVVPVTVSIGVADTDMFGRRPVTRSALLEATDRALYEAKGAGRNQVCPAVIPAGPA